MTLIDEIVSFVRSTSPSGEVLEQSRKALANWLSVVAHASFSPHGVALDRLAEDGGEGLAVGLGTARLETAALLNAAKAHLDDFDDTHLETMTHPSTPVIAALAAALTDETDWDEFLSAIAVGTEVTIGVAALLGSSHYDAGWHITASAGTLGAAAAVARLWHVDANTAVNALALAALQPIGLRAAFGTMGKAFQVGRAAECGVSAVRAALAGVDGPRDAMEHPRGLRITTASFAPEAVLRLGNPWEFLKDTFKPYPSGIVTHPAIEAAVAFYEQGVKVDAIQQIRAQVNPLVAELTAKPQPKTPLEVKFSVAYLIALGLIRGYVGPEIEDAPIQEEVQDLADRVELLPDATVARDSAVLHLLFSDGSALTRTVEHARGSIKRPMTWDDLEAKYRKCLGRVNPTTATAVWHALRNSEGKPRNVLQQLTARPADR